MNFITKRQPPSSCKVKINHFDKCVDKGQPTKFIILLVKPKALVGIDKLFLDENLPLSASIICHTYKADRYENNALM